MATLSNLHEKAVIFNSVVSMKVFNAIISFCVYNLLDKFNILFFSCHSDVILYAKIIKNRHIFL